MTAVSPVSAHIVLVVTAALLFYLAVADLREFKIRNELVVLLAVLYVVHAALSGRWAIMHWNLGFAAAMFVLMLVAYAQNLVGGGDLKLMTVAFLWSGVHCVAPLLIGLAGFTALHAVAAKLNWVHAQRVNGRSKVAFAPSVAAGLIVTFMSGCFTHF